MTYCGVDACKGGWVAVVIDDAGFSGAFTAPYMEDLEARAIEQFSAAIIVVDIPIGIPDSGPRKADALARAFIRPRGSSVFPTPVRAALMARSYAEARIASVAASGKSLSSQAYHIGERILDVEGHMLEARIPIREGHPEVSFRAMNGAGIVDPKKTFAGAILRRDLLAREGIEVPIGLEKSLRGAALDDLLDAASMAWTARRFARGEAGRLPPAEHQERFSDFHDAAIWF